MFDSFQLSPVGQTSLKLPNLSFGAAPIGNLYKKIDDDDVHTLLHKVWDLGYRYFDTAPFYGFGLSERRIGDFLRTKDKESYILSTKVGRLLEPDSSHNPDRNYYIDAMPFRVKYDYSYDGIMKSYEHSIQRLGLEKIDILYMHDIGAVTHSDKHRTLMDIAMSSGYKALDELKRQKLVQAIGLGVNEYEVCEEALEYHDWDCFLLAGRYTLLEQEAIKTFLPKCKEREVSIIIGGVFNSGILATGAKAGAKYNYNDAPQEILDKVSRIQKVCATFDLPLQAVALQFPMLHGCVSSVLIGSTHFNNLQTPLSYLEVDIPQELWQALINEGLMLKECF